MPPGVNRVVVKGREYLYYQPGRGTARADAAVRLPDDAGSVEFWEVYRDLTNQQPRGAHPKSFTAMINAYKRSPEFSELAVATRRGYERHLGIIEDVWGNLQVSGLLPNHVLKLRDKYRTTPATANAIIRTLSSILSWSIPRGFRNDNPCQHVRKLTVGDGWAPWPWEMIKHLERYAPPWMWEAAAIALYTGQRQADVLAMPRAKVRNGQIEVRQEKTGRELIIPAHQKLVSVLDSIERRHRERQGQQSVQILTNSRGLPWTTDGFRTSWNRTLSHPSGALSPIKNAGLVFHGLRKSAVVTLLEAGCTDAEVGAITGQSRQMIEHYSKQVNQKRLAAAAILKWENAT
jgi:integrase